MNLVRTHEAFGWFSTRWEHLTHYLERIHPNMPLVLYAGVAALIGFIVKRYMQSLLNGIIIAVLFIGVAHYVGFISLDMVKINQFFGLSSHSSLHAHSINIIAWIKNNTMISAWSAGGFFIGYSLA